MGIPIDNKIDRLHYFSEQLIAKPYQLGPLGEGLSGIFDQEPLYRLDAFDCQTFVETVLALSEAQSTLEFKKILTLIRYHQGQIDFKCRNHFISPDWNRNNQAQGFIRDITKTILNEQQQAVFKEAKAQIDVPNWYRHFKLDKIKLCHANQQEALARLKLLHQQADQLSKKSSTIAYIPFSALFDAKGQANQFIFQQIPSGVVIEIVRPNWDLSQAIGTHLNVSHLGIALRNQEQLIYYHALESAGMLIKMPLIDYLKKIRKQPSIQGINIQQILF